MKGGTWVITMNLNGQGEIAYLLTHQANDLEVYGARGTGTFGDVAYECEQIITEHEDWEHV